MTEEEELRYVQLLRKIHRSRLNEDPGPELMSEERIERSRPQRAADRFEVRRRSVTCGPRPRFVLPGLQRSLIRLPTFPGVNSFAIIESSLRDYRSLRLSRSDGWDRTAAGWPGTASGPYIRTS